MSWSTVATAFKLTLRHSTPPTMLFFSGIVSCLVLLLLLAAQKKLRLLCKLKGRDLLQSMWLGLLNPFLYYLILFEAYDRLPAQVAQPLNYTWALTLTFLSVPFLNQKLGKKDLLGALVSYSGVLILSSYSSLASFTLVDPWGIALALVSTIIWAFYWIFNTRDKKDPVLGLFLNFMFGTFFVFVAMLFMDTRLEISIKGILGAAYIGIFEMGLAFYLWLKAMKTAENTARVSTLIFFSPFLSLVFIHFVLGEALALSTLLGLPLIVAGIIIQRLGFSSKSIKTRDRPPTA